jgi:hypothetical protein
MNHGGRRGFGLTHNYAAGGHIAQLEAVLQLRKCDADTETVSQLGVFGRA